LNSKLRNSNIYFFIKLSLILNFMTEEGKIHSILHRFYKRGPNPIKNYEILIILN
jgi:hypothetical protein